MRKTATILGIVSVAVMAMVLFGKSIVGGILLTLTPPVLSNPNQVAANTADVALIENWLNRGETTAAQISEPQLMLLSGAAFFLAAYVCRRLASAQRKQF